MLSDASLGSAMSQISSPLDFAASTAASKISKYFGLRISSFPARGTARTPAKFLSAMFKACPFKRDGFCSSFSPIIHMMKVPGLGKFL